MESKINYAQILEAAPFKFMDLHIHTRYSADGEINVTDILKLAEATGLELISITDHNTLDAYSFLETINPEKYYTGRILTGVEINLLFKGYILEGIAYGFDLNILKKHPFFSASEHIRREKYIADSLIKKAKAYNLVCSSDFYTLDTPSAYKAFYEEIKSHYENQDFLKQNKITRLREFYRHHFTNPKGAFYIDFTKIYYTFKDMKKIVNEAGGILSLAHPIGIYIIKNEKKLAKQLAKLQQIDGIECIHYNMTRHSTNYCYWLANKYKLIKTCGSDYHRKPHVLGYSEAANLKTIITK